MKKNCRIWANSQNKDENHFLKNLAGALSISLSIILSLLKIMASIYTGSLAIFSSLIDSLADIIASSVTFIAIKFSNKPASYDFKYGYGKAEALSSFIQSLFISGSGIFIFFDGLKRIFKPEPINDTNIGVLVMLVSLILTIALVIFQKYVIKKTNSLALQSDRTHYIVDIATNISVILALIIIKTTGIHWIDSLIAICIAIYLLTTAYKLTKNAIGILMDQELDDDTIDEITKLINKQPFTKGFHDLRTRSLGGEYLFEFHLELDPDISLKKAHDYAHITEDEILKIYPNSQVVIHQEPKGAIEFSLDKQIEKFAQE